MLRGAFRLIEELRKKRHDLTPGFRLFQELLDYLAAWQGRMLPYDEAAARSYGGFSARLRQELGNDARIAAIALAHGVAAVWTCNKDDFKRFPTLAVFDAESGKEITQGPESA